MRYFTIQAQVVTFGVTILLFIMLMKERAIHKTTVRDKELLKERVQILEQALKTQTVLRDVQQTY